MRIRIATTAAAGAALWLVAACADGLDLTTREILASGDVVRQFGRIGVGLFEAQGIDGRGRALVKAQLSRGAEGLFWAADDGVAAAWSADAPGGDPVRIGGAVTNARGDVVAAGLDAVEPWNARVAGLYRIRDGIAEPQVRRGAVDDDGHVLCDIGTFAINDAGVIAFSAAATTDGDCPAGAPARLYVLRGATPSRVAVALPDGDARALHLLGIAADGTVLADVVDAGRVVAIAGGVTRTVVASDMPGPTGSPLGGIRGTGSNAAGDVAFLGWSDDRFGVYRTRGAAVVRVVSIGDTTPDGFPITSIDASDPQLGDAGDVALHVEWMEAGGRYAQGAMVVSPDGAARVAPEGVFAGVNAAGAVALFDPAADLLARWEPSGMVPLLRAGDPAPDGSLFAARGVSAITCLGADGRVGAQATATDGAVGLLCADGGGVTKIARAGEPAPDGGRFVSFGGCAFSPDGSLLFGATTSASRSDGSLYRATAAGLERLAGSGTVAADGEVIEAMVVGVNSGPFFNVNDRGTVLFGGWVQQRPRLLRLRPGAPPAALAFDLGGPPYSPLSLDGGIDADDRVYAIAGTPADQAIVVSDGDRTSVLARVADLQTPLGPVGFVDSVRARGDRLLIFGKDGDRQARLLQYTASDGFADVLPTLRPFTLLAATEQRTLVAAATADGAAQLLLDPDGLHEIGARRQLSDPSALAVNDRSNLLFRTDHTPLGTERQALAISGPRASGNCFAPPTGIYSDQPAPTPTPERADCVGDDCARLVVGTVDGDPGDRVRLSVILQSGPWLVAGAQGDLALVPALRFGVSGDGQPACRVNPDIDKNATAFAFLPAGCGLTGTCTAVRALVLAIDNVDAIPSGAELFTCDAAIAADAEPGRHPLPIALVGASDPIGVSVPSGGIAGTLEVHDSGDQPQQPPIAQPAGGGGGCQVDPHTPDRDGILALAAAELLLLLLRRRQGSPASCPTSEPVHLGGGADQGMMSDAAKLELGVL